MDASSGYSPSIHASLADPTPLESCAAIWCLATGRPFDTGSMSDPAFAGFLAQSGIDTPAVTPFFDNWHYIDQAGDDARLENLLLHYCRQGAAGGLQPHPMLDPAFVTGQAGRNDLPPLLAFLIDPDNIDPHPLFEGAVYGPSVGFAFLAGEPPALAFLRRWADRPAQFSRFFSWRYYLAEDPLASQMRLNPLVQFLSTPVANRGEPNPMFQRSWYAAAIGDRLPTGMDPLVHFLTIGLHEGAMPNPFAAEELRLELAAQEEAAERLSRYMDISGIDTHGAGFGSV